MQTLKTQPAYRGAIATGAVALAALMVLVLLLSTGLGMTLDETALGAVQRVASPGLVVILGGVTRLGNEAIAVMLPLLVVLLWVTRLRWQVAELLLATGGAQLWNDALKMAFHRERPTPVASVIPGQAYSFPSGHAMVSIAFYGVLAYIGWRVLNGTRRVLWISLMVLLVLAVGVSRLFLDVHYPSDVLASWAAGLLWLDLSLVLVGLFAARVTARRQRPGGRTRYRDT